MAKKAKLSTSTDPVVACARELKQIWAIYDRAPEGQNKALWDRKEALEDLMATAVPTTIEGAVAQIIVAGGYADLLHCSDYTGHRREYEADTKRIMRLLYGALAVLAPLCELSREELAGESYMPERCDDHTDVAA